LPDAAPKRFDLRVVDQKVLQNRRSFTPEKRRAAFAAGNLEVNGFGPGGSPHDHISSVAVLTFKL